MAAVALFAGMDAMSKVLADVYALSVVQIVWARYAFAVPVILVTTPLAAWSTLRQECQAGDYGKAREHRHQAAHRLQPWRGDPQQGGPSGARL